MQKPTEIHPSTSDDIEKVIQVHLHTFGSYRHENIYARVDQILVRNKPVRDTDGVTATLRPDYSATTSTTMRAT